MIDDQVEEIRMKLGSIEAGGTKFVCAVGTEDGDILERMTIPTETPEETIPKVIQFFKQHPVGAIGIGSFGPISVKKTDANYGNILNTPKLAWANFPFLKTIEEALQIPIEFTTDVNAAALGEYTFGAGQGLSSCLYITIGTGIGAGAIFGGEILEGISHPEMGHVIIRRHPEDNFEGVCPYHRDCLEGMASGPAIEKRWGKKGIELAERKEVWELEAYYIAQAIVQYTMILMPERIIIGGGVSNQTHIFTLIQKQVKELLNNYLSQSQFHEAISEYIVPPGLGNHAGIVGGLVLAKKGLEESHSCSG